MEGQRSKYDRVHDAEDRTVGADADGQRQDRRRGKRRRAAKLADGVAHVAGEIVGRAPPPDIPAHLANERHASERAPGGGDRGRTGHSLRHQRIDLLLEVKLDLVGEVAVHAAAREEIADPAKRAHGFTGVSTSLMPSSICSKLDTSRSRCFLPAGVSW